MVTWLFEHFQIVALILIAFAGWVKSRMDARNEEQVPPAEPFDEQDVFGPDAQWEREQPTTGSLPPAIPRSFAPPPPLVSVAGYEANREAEVALKHQIDLAERLRTIRETKATTTGGAAATRARVAASKAPAKAATVVELSLRSRLRNKGELRRAFVVNEILSQPLSQR